MDNITFMPKLTIYAIPGLGLLLSLTLLYAI